MSVRENVTVGRYYEPRSIPVSNNLLEIEFGLWTKDKFSIFKMTFRVRDLETSLIVDTYLDDRWSIEGRVVIKALGGRRINDA